ncbi:ThuA domain-containing protein [Streptomyces sp. SID4945]|uniref:ThuA domain-containing protein n=1 Tax=Streptomyces sp. SID4945 TaxID=2690285 RepID=UPI00081DDE0C|nr:carbohydrate-binding protein [Streptomyces sp. SID4945]SCF43437.1 Type 1 glutamine amidotransferase (GATase1) [Streptomyces sp. LcepLS]
MTPARKPGRRQGGKHPRRLAALAALALGGALLTGPVAQAGAAEPYDVLVFSKTAGFRHDSIPTGIATFQELGGEHGFTVTATEDASAFTPANLAAYDAVVFLSTTGDVLDDTQQDALQAYVDDGGGFMGVHAAADTEYDWPYYQQLVGAWFKSHPAIQDAVVETEDHEHPATAHFGPTWLHNDELYNYRTDPRGRVHVLQTLDESSYTGGEMGEDHPITWCHPQETGRSFYTGLGHTNESYADPDFRQLLLGGLEYAAGQKDADCAPSGVPGGTPVEAESYTDGQGVQPAGHGAASGGQTLGFIENGDWAGYAHVPVDGAATFTAKVSSAGAGGTIHVRAGAPDGPELGTADVPNTGSWETFQSVTTPLTAGGTGPLYLSFTGGAGSLFDIDSFTLAPAGEGD